MPYSVKILADSLSPCGKRLTTWELTYPRFIHSEMMTHRMFSRNAASSRAIPTKKLLEQVKLDPALPIHWGKNEPGMRAKEEVADITLTKEGWLKSRDAIYECACYLLEKGTHKQVVNRLLEPYLFITVILTATEFNNFFKLRCSDSAQPEIKWVADEMKKLYLSSNPTSIKAGQWHLPLIFSEDRVERTEEELKKISTARAARVSYLTHDGKRDHIKDFELFDKLMTSGHWSPLEHVAMALDAPITIGNFVGWKQYRKFFDGESGL